MSGNNAYSLISMSGTMLTAAHDGYWNADKATLSDIANTWAKATVQNGVACCDCSCGNIAMMQWAAQYVNPDILAQLLPKLYDATQNPVFLKNTNNVPPENTDPSNNEASTPNPVKGSTSSSTISANSTTTSNNQFSQSTSASNGQSVSDAGQSAPSGDVGGSSAQGADVKKSIEINPVTQQSASEVGMSLIAVLGVICLILIIGVGYFRNKDEDKNSSKLDELFNEKIM